MMVSAMVLQGAGHQGLRQGISLGSFPGKVLWPFGGLNVFPARLHSCHGLALEGCMDALTGGPVEVD